MKDDRREGAKGKRGLRDDSGQSRMQGQQMNVEGVQETERHIGKNRIRQESPMDNKSEGIFFIWSRMFAFYLKCLPN
jgi:hypothetical protein